MTRKVEQVAQSGPPQELISHINHLHNLLKNLPSGLPSHPNESQYCFGLNVEDVAEEGVWYAFNRNLEACFKTHAIPRSFVRRGGCVNDFVSVIELELGQYFSDLYNY